MKRLLMIVVALCSMLHAEQVALSGTVKDSANPLEGVTVTLAKIKDLSTVTKANGTFTLTNITGVRLLKSLTTSFGFSFRNNTIVFTSGSEQVSGTVSLYSIDGRVITGVTLDNLSAGQQRLVLPTLSSGTYLLAGTVNGKSFTQSLVFSGNNQLRSNTAVEAGSKETFTLGKSAAAAVADTLIASKEGFDTTRYPLTSYSKDGIAIAMVKKGAGGFTITSTAFKAKDEMPDKYTCEGKSFGGGIAPPLAWSGIPAAAKSLALFFKDTTAAAGTSPSNGYHWGMWNIPITVTGMPEGLNGDTKPAAMGGAEQKSAYTGSGNQFFGPCPDFSKKGGIKDIYFITLYAFDKEKITPPTSSLMQMDKYFDDNDIAKTTLEVWSDAKPK